ncbi:sugar ABC transporter substrate-binding protein [Geodermatophilus sp. URMC 62]|uniref:sugar ABC transporter substrate-binding protein n=1 Tax=Geodermatophilus sp. URMC 62 TaxID=3423414 RepID=UPI00406C31D6
MAAAQQSIESLTQPAEEFPITEPLEELPEPGTTVAFLDLGTPVTAQAYDYLSEAAEVAGVELQRVQTGQSPQEINAAMNSLVESKPDAVIDIAVDPALFTPQLEALREQGTVFIASSIVNGEEFGFDDSQIFSGVAGGRENGKAVASALLAETNGEATELVFYRVPEIPFTPLILEGVEERLDEQCPDCNLRVVDISIAEVGSTAARTVVSDLQAHPETEAFIASIDELQIGLPAAMEVAGMDVPGIGNGGSPINIQQTAEGQQLGTLASDIHMVVWFAMDQALRGLAGQEHDYSDLYTQANPALVQIFTKDNLPSDPEVGYVAFEDYKEQFAKLWTGE